MKPDPVTRLRDDARLIFLSAVGAARPERTVKAHMKLGPHGRPVMGDEEMAPDARLFIVAFGKASVSMASSVAEKLSPEVFPGEGIVVVNRENYRALPRFHVLPSSHPVPDAAGTEAARRVISYLHGATERDDVLVLISGGGSALLPAPAEGITLEDKVATTRLLLACGATIREINTVRKHLSRLKGGGLSLVAAPARIESLIVSDVIGDDLSTIASGPTAPDASTFADALRILEAYDLRDRVPAAVLRRLEEGKGGSIPETPKPGDPHFARVTNTIVASNRQSVQAAANRAEELGYRVTVASWELTGEARDAGSRLAEILPSALRAKEPRAFLAGGETTVTLAGDGRGGRNQELAVGFSLRADALEARAPWAFLSGGTDGRDGPTDAAGGIVDAGTLRRIAASGLDVRRELARNNTYDLLDGSGDLLVTGGTGTNVADIQVLLTAPPG